MDLVPCVHCKRHVGVSETACPFCASALPPQRPQFAFASRLTRAAIFSAAAATGACKDTPKQVPAPAPQTGSATAGSGSGSGSDDLEKMLDAEHHAVDHVAPVDGGSVTEVSDGGVPGDAGLTPEQRQEIVDKKLRDSNRRKATDVFKQRELERQRVKIQVNNKPYGAPPARRRVV